MVGLIKKDSYSRDGPKLPEAEQDIYDILGNLAECVQPHSYQLCIKEGRVVNMDNSDEGSSYFTYSFFGKKTHNKLRINALSYAYKLARFLNSEKRLRVTSGGGVSRKKKLQMGSVVPLCKSQQQRVDISRFRGIHLVE